MSVDPEALARAVYRRAMLRHGERTSHRMVTWEELGPSSKAQDIALARQTIDRMPPDTDMQTLIAEILPG